MTCNNILEAIGRTPLIRLNKITDGIRPLVYAKCEGFNPGQSAKDRIALHMVEEAERNGQLRPGGTLIEATSGNTGFSLAMVAAIKGYRCVLTVTSKVSREKIDMLEAMGAEVIVCPKEAKPEDHRSYYKVAERKAREIPNSLYINQNFNTQNAKAHYLTTGPEIWEQTEGKITCLIASAGTGGTLSGTAQYLKEKNPDIRIIGVDAYGSALKKYHETGEYDEREIYSYQIEGTGKNIIPANCSFELIDKFVKVSDKESAFRARELATMEGILAGYSSGAGVQALLQIQHEFTENDLVVLIFPDHGSKYLGKVFNNKWMEDQGFFETLETVESEVPVPTAFFIPTVV
ncbi:MAG: cysteine synthase family protein [Lewinellaceae bacterium]|nr:cysteine synthase family protein [Saprospiraceae bacterium]MCB9337120.1 cysteine synthase family protein [Lewinellaceae bacterium]